jgi:parallel beta-helix repeat protein
MTLKRKCLAVGIILLFVGTSIIPSIAQDTEKPLPTSRGWLYVGGSGPGNYSRIQAAINNSNNGDTVYVYDDSSPYYEHIVITSSINLTGENKETTIIDGNGSNPLQSVILLAESASLVTIQGFTIKHGFDGISIESNNNTITRNIISNNDYGIYLDDHSFNNTILDNLVTSNNRCGVVLIWGCNNTIMGNNITSNGEGINLYMDCCHNIIKNNNIQNSVCGIFLEHYCDFNIITGNSISNSTCSIDLFQSGSNTIEGNNIENNKYGLSLYISGKNLIKKNNFIRNEKHAIFAPSWRNIWDANYWDNWIGLKLNWPVVQKFPKVLVGMLLPPWFTFNLPYFNFDWHPAQEPYDIPGMT